MGTRGPQSQGAFSTLIKGEILNSAETGIFPALISESKKPTLRERV